MNNEQILSELEKLNDQQETHSFLSSLYRRDGVKWAADLCERKAFLAGQEIQKLTLLLNSENEKQR